MGLDYMIHFDHNARRLFSRLVLFPFVWVVGGH